MHARAIGVAVGIGIAVGRGEVHADCARDAGVLRATLEHDAHRAAIWRYGWAIGFGAGAIAQAALVPAFSDRRERGTLWVGAAKSAIGAVSRLAIPLRVPVPPATADACADVAALHAAIATAGQNERVAFWLNHVGGLLVNLAGVVVLARYTDRETALLSFAIGYPVGLAGTYTVPRDAWHAWRDTATITVAPTTTGGATVGIAVAW